MTILGLRRPVFLSLMRVKSTYTPTINSPVFPFTIHHKSDKIDRVNSSWNKFYQHRACDFTKPLFILHDGPPYANGDLHIGHALNKILKDIIIRLELLSGYRVQYAPGWDCHGLPIELKALEKGTASSPSEIRKAASMLAAYYVNVQRSSFMDWGIIGSWDKCYKTMDKQYQAHELRAFASLYCKGFIYRSLMPIYWSPVSKSALAESELEYHPEHKSISVYLMLKLTKFGGKLASIVSKPDDTVFALIWTTTPWTLPSNEAIAYDPDCRYVVTQDLSTKRILIASEAFADQLKYIYPDHTFRSLGDLQGSDLQDCLYSHPFRTETERDISAMPFLPAQHVSHIVGTGLVHTAPCHGQDDFKLGCKYGLPMNLIVDENGRFTEQASPQLSGLSVLGDGNLKVIELMQSQIVHQETITHSYPYDWRAKTPIIVRISDQWFVDTAKLAKSCMSAYQDVTCIPPTRKASMLPFLSDRPQWCISRQRSWGVPIPVILKKKDMSPIVDEEFINYIANRVQESGSDFWFTESLDELVPNSFWSKWSITPNEALKNVDVFDVWFDSGLSWLCALQDNHNSNPSANASCATIADVYLEGQDQFRGWFSSSLILGVALTGRSPYKSIVVHGFASDSEGRKMSKSVGNVVNPLDVLKRPNGCLDVLRRWAATSGLDASCPIGDKELHTHEACYKSLRNCLRFMLGNVYDFCPRTHVLNLIDPHESRKTWFETTLDLINLSLSSNLPHLGVLDKSVLCSLGNFVTTSVDTYYPQFRFDSLFSDLDQLISELSDYFTFSKDKLYFDESNSPRRRAVQTTLWLTLECLVALLAPLQPYLMEEVESARQTQFAHICKQMMLSNSDSLLERLSCCTHLANAFDPKDIPTVWSAYLSAMRKWSTLDDSLEAVKKLFSIREAILKSYTNWIDMNPDHVRTGSKSNPLSNLHVHISIPVTDEKLQHIISLHHPDASTTSECSDLCLFIRSASVSWTNESGNHSSCSSDVLEFPISIPDHEFLVKLSSIPNGGRCHRCHRFSYPLINHVCQRCSLILTKRVDLENLRMMS